MRAMKDSGIAWIGEIPEDWEIKKLKYTFFHSNAGEVIDKSYWNCGSELLYTCQKEPINSNYSGFPEAKRTGLNDLLLTRNATPYVFIPETHSIYSNVVQRISLRQEYDRRYIRYSLLSAIDSLVALGDTIPSYNMEIWENITLPIMQQQHRIADYLDRKCSQIDAIIARQQEVIEKLKAYKLSVITEAVTKGLNPHAPMKDSGVEWIGEIPEQWETASISRVATVVRGASPRPAGDPRYFNGQDVPWITVAEVTKDDGKYIFSTESYLTKEGAECSRLVEKGTLLLSNSGATLGVPKVTLITGCINDGSVAFLDLNIEQMYLLYVFKSRTLELRKQMQGYGQPNLNTTIVKNIVVPLPHPDEQKSISEYLDKRCKAIDDTIEMKEKVVERLSKYKKSLIYEVVTGKKEV